MFTLLAPSRLRYLLHCFDVMVRDCSSYSVADTRCDTFMTSTWFRGEARFANFTYTELILRSILLQRLTQSPPILLQLVRFSRQFFISNGWLWRHLL